MKLGEWRLDTTALSPCPLLPSIIFQVGVILKKAEESMAAQQGTPGAGGAPGAGGLPGMPGR